MKHFTARAIGFLLLSGLWAEEPKLLLSENFNTPKKQGLYKTALRHKLVSLAKGEGPDGSDAIRVAYVGFERGSKRVVFQQNLSESVTEATLSFDVKFEQDFQFTHGGKMHGLGPKEPVTGGRERRPDGWSARIMWKKEGAALTYLYDQNPEKKYGVGDKTEAPVFKPGVWHRVELQVKLNDPGEANGAARILVDGKEVVRTTEVTFRASAAKGTDIEKFLFSTFHGGSASKWTPVDAEGKPTTVYALYDNVKVVEGLSKP